MNVIPNSIVATVHSTTEGDDFVIVYDGTCEMASMYKGGFMLYACGISPFGMQVAEGIARAKFMEIESQTD